MLKTTFLIATLVTCASLWADDTPKFGPWSLVKQTSRMDDSESIGIVSVATETEGGFSSKPSFLVMCTANSRMGVGLLLHDDTKIEPPNSYIRQPHTNVRLRHDKEKVYSLSGLPAKNSLVFRVSMMKRLFDKLEQTSILTIEVPFASGNTGIAVFSVTQFNEALKALPIGCKGK